MAQHYSDPARETDPHALPDVEVFHLGAAETDQPGWYWWPCLPGCLPDGEADGPYATEQDALRAARE